MPERSFRAARVPVNGDATAPLLLDWRRALAQPSGMRLTVLVASLLLAGCATTTRPQRPPNLVAAPGIEAPPQTGLYTACIADAITAGTYDRERGLIRFHCAGQAARGFYEGLAPWVATHDSELVEGERTLRFTERPQEDVYGLDYCWRDAGEVYGCTIALNVGEFLEEH